jgi:hypothetical protein
MTPREAAEAKITRRLGKSRWFQRGFAAFALIGGVAAGAAHQSESVIDAGMAAGVGASAGAVLESRQAIRQTTNTVTDYRKARNRELNTYNSEYSGTVLKVSGSDFRSVPSTDMRSFLPGAEASGFSGGLSPVTFWTSAGIATEIASGGAVESARPELIAFASLFALLGVGVQAFSEYGTSALGRAYTRQLDNIDGLNMHMEIDTP